MRINVNVWFNGSNVFLFILVVPSLESAGTELELIVDWRIKAIADVSSSSVRLKATC